MPQSQFNLSCLSRRGFIHSYMLKTSMTMSTYLYPLFHLLTCCMSTKSAGKFFLLIFIVDNHAYWFVVVLSFVLSRYKELIKLSLKKKMQVPDWGTEGWFSPDRIRCRTQILLVTLSLTILDSMFFWESQG